ncbi:MAG: hypothetical protein V4736_13760 [Bdellovibrionota bacterium]
MNRIIKKFHHFSNHPEQAQLVNFIRIGIALLTLIKIWTYFPIAQSDSIFQACWLIIALMSSLLLLINRFTKVVLVILIMIFIAGFFDYMIELRPLYLRSHHMQLLIISYLGLLLMGRQKGNHHYGMGFQLLRLTIILVYLAAIVMKLTPHYYSGLHIQQLFYKYYWGSDRLNSTWFEIVCQAIAIGSIFTEAAILATATFLKRPRLALKIGIAFHLVLFLVLPVSILSGLMILLLFLFQEKQFKYPI